MSMFYNENRFYSLCLDYRECVRTSGDHLVMVLRLCDKPGKMKHEQQTPSSGDGLPHTAPLQFVILYGKKADLSAPTRWGFFSL